MSRVLVFEWRRASSLRSTWGFLLLGILFNLALALGPLITDDELRRGADLESLAVAAGYPLGIAVLTTVCAQAFGHEYRDGTMRLVLSMFPRRVPVFVAKLLVAALLVALAVAAIEVIAIGFGAILGVASSGAGEVAGAALRAMVLAVWWGLMVASITALLRNLAAGIVVALFMATLGESLITALLASRAPWTVEHLPFGSALDWAGTGSAESAVTMLVWLALLLVPAGVLFVKRDA